MQLAQLGDAIYAAGDFLSEALADFVGSHAGVFDEIVQQSGFDGDQVHAHAGQNVGDHQGMHQERFAGIAQLTLVKFAGGAESFLYRGRKSSRGRYSRILASNS